jgi:hypothetical protein
MTGKQKKSVRGLIRASLTLILDSYHFATQWDPLAILLTNLQTAEQRPWMTEEVRKEVADIIINAT